MNREQKKNLKLSSTAFALVKNLLPAIEAEQIRGFIFDHNEWGVGVEMLVDVLLDQDIAISTVQKKAILDAMEAMELDRSQEKIRVA